MHGDFAHNPEPLPEHLKDLSAAIKMRRRSWELWFADADVDRLALVCETGDM